MQDTDLIAVESINVQDDLRQKNIENKEQGHPSPMISMKAHSRDFRSTRGSRWGLVSGSDSRAVKLGQEMH